MTHFLRFTDQAAFNAACETANYWITEEPERPFLCSHTHTFDVIGPIAQVTKRQLSDDGAEIFAAFTVALTNDHIGWLYSFTAPELEEQQTATIAVNFANQNTGDYDSQTIEISAGPDGVTIEQLIFDEDGTEIDREVPTNTTDSPGATFDAWHVNAKLQKLPDGWDAYVVTPSSPVRVFAGDS